MVTETGDQKKPNPEPKEALLAGLIDSLVTGMQRGEQPDIDRVLREHPEHAEELRSLWGAVLVTEELAKPHTGRIKSTRLLDEDVDSESAILAAALQPPKAIGDFDILREIGRGGMGVVYEATQRSLGRRVALKTLFQKVPMSPSDVARFRAEAESAAGLDHPHIIPVFTVGSHEDTPYFTMRYIEGSTLARRLAAGPMASREAASLLVPICQAIHYAHQNGVLHRDLKPANVLIDRGGLPYVTDFGLAKRIEGDSNLTQSGAILGTPGYMAPEQASGNRDKVCPQSDVYGLGAILYHMVTGRPPFQAATPVDTVLAVREQDPLPPRLLNSAIDRELEMIILRCLQKPVELRYSNAAALAEDLQAYLAGGTISVRKFSLPLLFSRTLRETHHASILENWGVLWMWHSVALMVLCVATNVLQWREVRSPLVYICIWTVGFGAWALIFWSLRRRGGPITFVERQIAHVWAGSILVSSSLFFIEILLELPVLSLSPVLALVAGMVFVAKAGILSGWFYIPAVALFLCSLVMVLLPQFGLTIFGIATAAGFFLPGLKYYRQRRKRQPAAVENQQ